MALAAVALLAASAVAGRMTADTRDSAAFRQAVDSAISGGARALRADLRSLLDGGRSAYYMGHVALVLTALLKSGTGSDDGVVQSALRTLEGLEPAETYSVSCYLMALDAYWQQLVRESIRSLRPDARTLPRTAEGPVRAKMLELLEWLIEARVPARGVWHYRPSRGGFDHSNTQFAVLGIEIALENDIPVPEEVLREIGEHLLSSMTGKEALTSFRVALEPPPGDLLGPTSGPRRLRVRTHPAGWSYRDDGSPTESMTAAGASNLFVVRESLRKVGSLGKELEARLDQALFAAVAWISARLRTYVEGGDRPYYYTLYSLEKACDLGRIRLLDERDWYVLGARELLRRQRRDGRWGQHTDTAFALLFLTRATAPTLHALPPPTIITEGGGNPETTDRGDAVYVESLDGFVSAREFFAYLRQVRSPKLLDMARDVVKNYDPFRREELIPYLVALWGTAGDPITSFCRSSLGDITGEPGKGRDYYRETHEQFRSLLALLEEDDARPGAVRELFARMNSVALKSRLLLFIERHAIVEACPELIRELAVDELDYRRRVHGILLRFTGELITAPEGNRRAEWEETAGKWEAWWQANGATVLTRNRIRRLVKALCGEATSPVDRQAALESLVGEGLPAVPPLIEALGRPTCRIEVLLALEAISGEARGFRAEDWRAWWRTARR